jgi:MFS family permease
LTTPRTLDTAGEVALPSDRPARAAAPRCSALRASLAACTAEGVVTEFAAACCGASALTAWALYLGASKWMLGLLSALPFLAQLVQVPVAYITTHIGVKRATIAGVAVSRQLYFGLVLLPLLPLSNAARCNILLVVAGIAAVLGVLGGNGWGAWMGNLVPSAIRGRYLGRRTSACTLASAVAALVTGAVLDAGRRLGEIGWALGLLSAVVGVTGVICAFLLSRMHLPPATTAPPEMHWKQAVQPITDRRARSVLAYQATWGASAGLGGSLYALFMVENLKIGFLGVTLHAVTSGLARTVAAPLWGRAADRVGVRPILVLSAAGIALVSIGWVFASPSCLWILALDAVVAGSLDSGQLLGAVTLPLRVSPREKLPFYMAAFGMVGGLVLGLASITGGAIASALPDRVGVLGIHATSYSLLFAGAAALRGIAALIATRIAEPGAGSLRDLVSLVTAPLFRSAKQTASICDTVE